MDEIRRLTETAEAGERWYVAPDQVSAGDFQLIVACAPFGPSSWTAYDVDFRWGGGETCTFTFDISDYGSMSPGSMASSSPWEGWTAWAGPDLVMAWSMVEDWQIGAAKIEGGSPFEADGATESPEAWAELARSITMQLMR